MKNFNIITLGLVVLLNCMHRVFAENNDYIITFKRRNSDVYYDDASDRVKDEIDELVNNRMNDIYDIINENQETYVLEDGQMDVKLNEIKESSLKKRNQKNIKFKFINKNRPARKKSADYVESYGNSDYEYIDFESKLIGHLCPIKNTYAIKAYLSDEIVDKVKSLPNVISCEKSVIIKPDDPVDKEKVIKSMKQNMDGKSTSSNSETVKMHSRSNNKSNKFYDTDYILKETNWTNVNIQENTFLHLSLISQARYDNDNIGKYDNNYYYPSTGGHGVDIYVIEGGFSVNHIEFDTYEGTDHERTVTCDAIIEKGIVDVNEGEQIKKCEIASYEYFSEYEELYSDFQHGVATSSVAAGTYVGVAKYANIHVLSTGYEIYDIIIALDYIKQHAKPHKTVINVSRGGLDIIFSSLNEKIDELIKNGYILIVSAGNSNEDQCLGSRMDGKAGLFLKNEDVITVGATENELEERDEKNSDWDLYNYDISEYSNYGHCVDIFAPGYVMAATYPSFYIDMDKTYEEYSDTMGTSFSAPIVSGVAALIISEHPEIQFTQQLMRQYLLDLSIKDILQVPEGTPNVYINNGKKVVYSSNNTYYGCGLLSGNSHCSEGCCSREGKCVKSSSDQCKIENGCQSEFGQCYPISGTTSTTTKVATITKTTTTKKATKTATTTTTTKKTTKTSTTTTTTKKTTKTKTTVTKKTTVKKTTSTNKTKSTKTTKSSTPIATNSKQCGPSYGKCKPGYCCSKYGYCGKTSDYCNNQSQIQYNG